MMSTFLATTVCARQPIAWQDQAVANTRIMAHVKWTPIAGNMPRRGGGYFEKGTEYTGIPYSSVSTVGRCIGFDIYLKTFLAAVENPQSVLYTEDLRGKVRNAAPYYGKVCSTLTSYALQCAVPYRSSHHAPEFRNGVVLVEPQSAQATKPGDIIYTPPAEVGGGAHVELVTAVGREGDNVISVRVEEGRAPTTRNKLLEVSDFDSHISSRSRKLYRVTDLDAWREQNRAESFLFPDYDEDSNRPAINRVLLLDRGDWVPYFRDQTVKFNVMDRDSQGVQSLVVKRGEAIVEEIALRSGGVIERLFSDCGSYSAHCVMSDGTLSQACEFSVCDLDFSMPVESPTLETPWDIHFTACNLNIIAVQLSNPSPPHWYSHFVWLTDHNRHSGRVTIPAGLMVEAGRWSVRVIGENEHGRLTRQRTITLVEGGGVSAE